MLSIFSLQREEGTLTVQIKNRCSIVIKIILLAILIPCSLIPIFTIFVTASFGVLSFGVLFGAALFTAIFIYPFFKITVWQFYGQETFHIYKDKVTYEAYFKFLKTQFAEIKITHLEILFSDEEQKKDEKIGNIVFQNEEDKLKSALRIKESDYQLILAKYDQHLHP